MSYYCFKLGVHFFCDLILVHVSFKENVPIDTFNISLESTQNKPQYGTKITFTEIREGKLW